VGQRKRRAECHHIKMVVHGKGTDECTERSSVHDEQYRGRRTDPRGTPPKDVQWKTQNDLNQWTELRTEPQIPSHDGRRVIKMLWLIVSKAAVQRGHNQQCFSWC